MDKPEPSRMTVAHTVAQSPRKTVSFQRLKNAIAVVALVTWPIMEMKAQHQEGVAAGHVVSRVRKHKEMDSGALLAFSDVTDIQVFFPQLNQMCFHGYSNSNCCGNFLLGWGHFLPDPSVDKPQLNSVDGPSWETVNFLGYLQSIDERLATHRSGGGGLKAATLYVPNPA